VQAFSLVPQAQASAVRFAHTNTALFIAMPLVHSTKLSQFTTFMFMLLGVLFEFILIL
jgi:hypothetical protein